MNIESTTKQLTNFFERVIRATGKNLSLPVLACFYLEAIKGESSLTIKATNLDIGVEMKLKVKCLESGTAAVPATVLLNLLSSVNGDVPVSISEKERNLIVTTKNNSSTIKCIPHDDFPLIPKVEGSKSATIKTKDLINGIKSVWYSASNSTIKPELSSVYITAGEQELLFISTDSFRLAEKKVYYKHPTEFLPVLIPSKNIPDIVKIIESYEGDIKILFDKNQVSFELPDGVLTTRIIDGSFPDYKQIIPKQAETTITLLKNDLITTVRSAQVFSDAFNQIRFRVKPKDKNFTITTKNSEVGEYVENLPAKIEGEEIEISFNHKYILDCMQSIESSSLILKLAGAAKPMMIQGADDKSFTYIVMPMNR